MAYDSTNLNPNDTTDLQWALAWTRFYLQDTSEPESYTDVELLAILNALSFSADSVTYYRPHEAAAHLIVTDPNRALSESLMSAMVTHRRASGIASSLRKSGRWIDDLIEAAAEERPPSGLTLTPVF